MPLPIIRKSACKSLLSYHLAVHPIHIGAGVSGRLSGLLDAARIPARRFIVSNPTVWRLHGDALRGVTSEEPILIPDGERYLGRLVYFSDVVVRRHSPYQTLLDSPRRRVGVQRASIPFRVQRRACLFILVWPK